MKVIVIGYGSIGKRHVSNLLSLGINEIILFRAKGEHNKYGFSEIRRLDDILLYKPDFVIISNPTYLHFKFLKFLMKNNINILCEKPLVSGMDELNHFMILENNYTKLGCVAYNMRFHPCIIKLKDILDKKVIGKVLFARFFVGQYFPDWRSEIEHLKSYSATREYGGGVVLDLIHELDLAENLFGKPVGNIHAIVKKISDITNDSEDIAEIMYTSENNQIVSIHLDYLVRGYKRDIFLGGTEGSISVDLFENDIKIFNSKGIIIDLITNQHFDKNYMYLDTLRDYIMFLKDRTTQCNLPTFYESISTLKSALYIKQKYRP